MLTRFRVRDFKSLADVDLDLPKMLVLLGPNAAGKSNFLEALQCLSRLVTERTVKDAMAFPLRGYPVEAFRMPAGGLKELMSKEQASFCLEADIQPKLEGSTGPSARKLRYRVEVATQPNSGAFSVTDEYLAALQVRKDEPRGSAVIEKQEHRFVVRIRGQGAHPMHEGVGQNHTVASVPAYGGSHYPDIETLRAELSAWRAYYLDPRVAMRAACPPSEVTDIGSLGETIAPYLYRLKMQHPKHFDAVRRTLRTVIPGVEGMDVDLNKERGELEISIVQDAIRYPIRVISEGTLRVLALCALCVNPWHPALVAFEEPENGVHPRRLDLIAEMLISLATQEATQVVVTTHSPRFCDAVWKRQRECGEDIALVAVRRRGGKTLFSRFDTAGPLFREGDLMRDLTSPTEDGVFEALIMRGLVDE
jgi:predicted ATPase